jgi:hypothetical protein
MQQPGFTGSQAQAYESGRRGDASPTHASLNERDAFDLGTKHRRQQKAKAHTHTSEDSGAGAGLLMLILVGTVVVVGLAIVVPAALASLLSAALLLALLATLRIEGDLRYWQAYKMCAVATTVFIGVAAAVYFGAAELVRDYGRQSFFDQLMRAVTRIGHGLFMGLLDPADGLRRLAQFHAALSRATPAANGIIALACAALFAPAVLGAALALHLFDEWPAAGLAGYAAALVATLVVLLPGLAISLWALARLGQHIQLPTGKGLQAPLENMAIAGALLTLAWVVLVPLVVGVATRLLGLLWSPLADPVQRGWLVGTGWLVALVYGIGMALAMLMFRRGDLLAQWADAWLAGGPAVGALLWSALASAWPLALPAVALAGAVVAARHDPPFAGAVGYAAACVLGGAAATLLWWPVPVAGVMAYRAGLLSP